MIRLLERLPGGSYILQEFDSREPPEYVILSHTWHIDNRQEVTLDDIEHGTHIDKLGTAKLEFCAGQAEKDGVKYFWIDTCCIDKRNAVELAEAITSMFRWYKTAKKCYVYLQDMALIRTGIDDWISAFRRSRWFTRGWTLQELLAPKVVHFFDEVGSELGTRSSLQSLISEITKIPTGALAGAPLSEFSIEERLSWANGRRTKVEEDEVYCLLGLCDVSMPIIPGEGKFMALRRLHNTIGEFRGDVNLQTPTATQFLSDQITSVSSSIHQGITQLIAGNVAMHRHIESLLQFEFPNRNAELKYDQAWLSSRDWQQATSMLRPTQDLFTQSRKRLLEPSPDAHRVMKRQRTAFDNHGTQQLFRLIDTAVSVHEHRGKVTYAIIPLKDRDFMRMPQQSQKQMVMFLLKLRLLFWLLQKNNRLMATRNLTTKTKPSILTREAAIHSMVASRLSFAFIGQALNNHSNQLEELLPWIRIGFGLRYRFSCVRRSKDFCIIMNQSLREWRGIQAGTSRCILIKDLPKAIFRLTADTFSISCCGACWNGYYPSKEVGSHVACAFEQQARLPLPDDRSLIVADDGRTVTLNEMGQWTEIPFSQLNEDEKIWVRDRHEAVKRIACCSSE